MRPNKIILDFFSSNILVHTHVEKAAGTTLVDGLTQSLGRHRVHDIRSGVLLHPKKLTAAEKNKIWLLTGHFHYGKMDKYFARRKIYIATIREPFDRFESYINYIKPDHPAYKYVQDKNFTEIINYYLDNQMPAAMNKISRILTGSNNPSFEMVIENIENSYLLVVPYTRVNHAIQNLISLIGGVPQDKELHRNKGVKRRSPTDIKPELNEAITRFKVANELDQMVYKYVVDNSDKQFASISTRLENILERQGKNE